MLYVLIGKTCSGKSTVLKELVDLGYKPIVSYTTRPQRPKEAHGKDYMFISLDEYKSLDESNLLVSKNSFVNFFGEEWFYGIHAKDINPDQNLVVITEPIGFKELQDNLGKENVVSIYLNASYEERLIRGANRNDISHELIRRMIHDEKDFEGFEEVADYVIESTDRAEVLQQVLEIINR